jgi:hypothetical protein
MELLFVGAIGLICSSMAKKRGRGPVKWFFLGVFFTILAMIVLLLLGNARGFERSMARPGQATAPAVVSGPTSTPRTTQNRSAGHQFGEVDLEALREAVRHSNDSSVTENMGVGTFAPQQNDERIEFQRHINGMLPTLVYPNVSDETNRLLRQLWLKLGQDLVNSGLAGGVNDDYEFYVVLADGTPIFFAPMSRDGTANTLAVQFGAPAKRYMNLPNGLQQWVSSQAISQSVEATLIRTGVGNEIVLWVMATYVPEQVTAQSLNALSNYVQDEAVRMKDNVPKKFGGIEVTFI